MNFCTCLFWNVQYGGVGGCSSPQVEMRIHGKKWKKKCFFMGHIEKVRQFIVGGHAAYYKCSCACLVTSVALSI